MRADSGHRRQRALEERRHDVLHAVRLDLGEGPVLPRESGLGKAAAHAVPALAAGLRLRTRAELRVLVRRLELAVRVTITVVLGALPVGNAQFDLVTAGQCWHWFDGEVAASEVRRLLVKGGRVGVCGFDWLPLPDTVSGVTEALIQAHNPSWTLGGVRDPGPEVRRQLGGAGFVVMETFTFDVDVSYTADSWRRRIGASAGILDLSAEAATAFDVQLADLLAERFPGDHLIAPHRVWALVAQSPG